jgi:hypothetical protein
MFCDSFNIYIYIYTYVWKLNQTVLELDLDSCQIIILSIYIPSTHAYTHVLRRLSLDLPYEKR